MAEKSEVIAQVMRVGRFRERVRAVSAVKAQSILEEATPDAQELAWAKLVVVGGYDAWMEALMILTDTQPVDAATALAASDATYATKLTDVLPAIIVGKGL